MVTIALPVCVVIEMAASMLLYVDCCHIYQVRFGDSVLMASTLSVSSRIAVHHSGITFTPGGDLVVAAYESVQIYHRV